MQPIRSKRGNANHIFGADSTDAGTQTQTNLAGRKSVLRMLKFLKTIPGGENASIDRMMNETATRETFRIKGETMITVHDYQTGRKFQDALSYSVLSDRLAHQGRSGTQAFETGSRPDHPTRSADPERLEEHPRFAGRCLSSDRYSNSAARVHSILHGDGPGRCSVPPCLPRNPQPLPRKFPWARSTRSFGNMERSFLLDPFFNPTKPSFMKRRSFLKTTSVASVAFAAPNLLTAKSKKALVLGKGEFQYTVEHGWGKLPDNHTYGNASHGVAIDKAGLIYVTHTGKPGSFSFSTRRANGSRPWAKSISDADMA